MIVERCARAIPKKLALAGKESKKFFNVSGKLICCPDVSQLLSTAKNKTIRDLLTARYSWMDDQARLFSQFLLPMLEYDPDRRSTADAMLQHPWMSPASTYIHLANHMVDADQMLPALSADLTAPPVSSFFADQTNALSSLPKQSAVFSNSFQFQPLSPSILMASTFSSPSTAFGGGVASRNDSSLLQKSEPSSYSNRLQSVPHDGINGSTASKSFNLNEYGSSSAALSSNIIDSNGYEGGGASFKYGRFDVAVGSNNSNKRATPQSMSTGGGGPAQNLLLTHNDLMRDGGDFLTDATAPLNSSGKFLTTLTSDAMSSLASAIDDPVRKIDSLKLRSQS